MRRRLLFMRDLIDDLLREIRERGMSIQLAARRMYWHGVPENVALRVLAGRK